MVSATKLRAAEQLVDELDPADRVRLLQYLAPRITHVPTVRTQAESDEAWRRLREIGDQIAAAAAEVPGPPMTQLLSEMRR